MPSIVVIGTGFSGTALAAQLAKRSWTRDTRVVLLDRGLRAARGIAYSTTHRLHLLNVPAGRMGAFPDDEGHFIRWLQRTEPAATGDMFVPRSRYGEYLEWVLGETIERAPKNLRLERRSGDAIRISRDGDRAKVNLRSGETLEADRVVLAIGTLPPRDPAETRECVESARYTVDPWAPGALQRVRTSLPILILGSGLTMVDVALALFDSGHRAGFLAVSRRGLLPLSHRDWPTKPPVVEPTPALAEWTGSASRLLRIVRCAARDAVRAGLDWRDVINGLRPFTPELWKRMPARERQRFVRHVRPFWETHRHRMSTRVAVMINAMLAREELTVVAGRLTACRPRGDRIAVEVRRRGNGLARYEVGWVINCTGPDSDFARMRDPLVAHAREAGDLTPDPLGLGVLTDEDGALVDASGRASSVLFTLGSPRKADLWECTAVPEVGAHADRLAQRLWESLERA